jgi:hypothetical protein
LRVRNHYVAFLGLIEVSSAVFITGKFYQLRRAARFFRLTFDEWLDWLINAPTYGAVPSVAKLVGLRSIA